MQVDDDAPLAGWTRSAGPWLKEFAHNRASLAFRCTSIPSNFFAVVSLRQMAHILDKVRHNPGKASQARALADEVADALRLHARLVSPSAGTVFAYETDGLGHSSMMDDANVPDLLSLPYLSACSADDPI